MKKYHPKNKFSVKIFTTIKPLNNLSPEEYSKIIESLELILPDNENNIEFELILKQRILKELFMHQRFYKLIVQL